MEKNKITVKKLVGNLILIVAIVAFVALYTKIFGSENNLIGVCAITAMLMFINVHLSLKLNEAILTTIGTFVFMGISTQISSINPFLGFVVNFISIFIISYLVTNRTETKAFLPFVLCYVFVEGTPITWSQLPARLAALLVGGILISLVYYVSHRKKDDSDHMNISEMIKTMDKDSLQFNFSLRMALAVSLAMLLGSIMGVEKSMWISLTAMSITQPHYDDTKTRVKERFFGTLIGSAIFIILFSYIFPAKYTSVVLLLLSYVYTFIDQYRIKMIFITMNALGAAMILFNTSESIPMRIAFIVIGICIALVVNKVIYRRYELAEQNKALEENLEKEKSMKEMDKVLSDF